MGGRPHLNSRQGKAAETSETVFMLDRTQNQRLALIAIHRATVQDSAGFAGRFGDLRSHPLARGEKTRACRRTGWCLAPTLAISRAAASRRPMAGTGAACLASAMAGDANLSAIASGAAETTLRLNDGDWDWASWTQVCSAGVQVRVAHFARMSTLKRQRTAVDVPRKRLGSAQPDPTPQFIRLRAPLKGRELTVLDAVARLPPQYRTPTAAATQMTLDGIGIPFSTLCAILRRLEHKGALRLGRVKG